MKKKLIFLDSLKPLTRDEMSKVKGGAVSIDNCPARTCSVFDGQTHNGVCGPMSSAGGTCLCITEIGQYTPKNGTSSCAV